MTAWEPWVAALFAPLSVWVLWRLQTASVDLLRRAMLGLLRYQTWLYNIVSWFGTLLHELSHASVLLLSGHGIKQFRAGVDQGHVMPRRMHKGPVGFLFFLVAALAPLFIPPLLVWLGLLWLVDPQLVPWSAPEAGLRAAFDAWSGMFVTFPRRLVDAIVALDVTKWQHAVILALIVLGIPGSRPSHVKGSRFHGEDDEGDIAVLRRKLRGNPWPFVAFLLLLYVLYFALRPFAPVWYWYPFQALWAVSLTGFALGLLSALGWFLVAMAGRAKWWAGLLPWLILAAVQVFGRIQEWGITVTNLASLLLFAAAAVAVGLVARRRVTF